MLTVVRGITHDYASLSSDVNASDANASLRFMENSSRSRLQLETPARHLQARAREDGSELGRLLHQLGDVGEAPGILALVDAEVQGRRLALAGERIEHAEHAVVRG